MSRLKPCPFCGSENIDYSIKTGGTYNKTRKYHVAMYCTDCNCYGNRTLIKITEEEYRNRECSVEKNEKYKKLAIESWNTRRSVTDSVIEQLIWERDIAISQLEQLGIGFGQKLEDEVIKKVKEVIRCD